MHHYTRLRRALFWGAAALLTCLSARADFTVSGRRILKDGVPFEIKGVCYNPTPIGENGSRSPNGDYYTSGYSAMWDRDLPRLRAMGANVIRIYGWAPTADHTAFLDRCYNNGDRPIYVLVNYWVDPATDWTNTSRVRAMTTNFTNIESRLGSHPAVLGLIVGNEVNAQNGNGWKAEFWSAMNSVAAGIKSVNSRRLVSVAMTDSIDQLAWANGQMSNIDFWCMQIYRGTSFGSFFSDFEARSTRPLVISEWGLDALNRAANTPYPDSGAFPGEIVGNLWTEIANASAVCAGGTVFEYCDEWFRAPGSDTTQDPGGWAAGGFPDGGADEEWFGLFSIAKNGTGLNVHTPRAAYYELAALWTSATPPTTPPPTTPPPVEPPPPTTPDRGIVDGTFESVRVGTDSFYAFAYAPSLSGWSFHGYAGIAGNNSGFTSGNAGAPDGTQVAFVQMQGSLSTHVSLSAGTYMVSAMTSNRATWGGQQTVAVYVNGSEVGRFTGGSSYQRSTSASFSVGDGTHEIRFVGQSVADATLFMDLISINPASASVTLGSGSFESPGMRVYDFWSFVYTPATVTGIQDWTFSGNSGVAANGSGFTSGNSSAPEGNQVAFVQMNNSSVSQNVTLPSSGTYRLSVAAAQRGNWNQSRQAVQVFLDSTLIGWITPSGSNYENVALSFSAAAGSHVLSFRGTAGDDSTVLLDNISLSLQ